MTEQGKIPLPSDPANKGKSLFERAEDLFGLDGFAAPPVPSELEAPLNRQPPRKSPPRAPAPLVETSPIAASPAEPAPVNVSGPEPIVETTEPATLEPEPAAAAIEFPGIPRKIDRSRLAEQGLIQPDGKVTTLLEEFRIVKRQVLLAARAGRRGGAGSLAQRVLVCSPLPGEGKTFCAANLALALAAEKDSEVVLVDADFAKPSVLSTLGLSAGPGAVRGLMDALADPAIRVEDCVIPTDVHGLYVLPAGNTTTSDSEYLASSRTAEVLDRLTQGAPNRMVIFDSPPALAATPAAELAKYVGQALLVARADITAQSALEDALSLLSACRDIKLLLNAAHFSPSGRRFGSYYGYGE